jgi:hypothetical protein
MCELEFWPSDEPSFRVRRYPNSNAIKFSVYWSSERPDGPLFEDYAGCTRWDYQSMAAERRTRTLSLLWAPIIYEKAWAKPLRPSILATSRAIHEIGTPMLYGYNTSRFVSRLVETVGMAYLESHDTYDLYGTHHREKLCPSVINDFLDFKHRVFTAGDGKGYTMVPSCQLITNMMIQSSGVDHDDLLSSGIARPLRTQHTRQSKFLKTAEQWAMFPLVRICEV